MWSDPSASNAYSHPMMVVDQPQVRASMGFSASLPSVHSLALYEAGIHEAGPMPDDLGPGDQTDRTVLNHSVTFDVNPDGLSPFQEHQMDPMCPGTDGMALRSHSGLPLASGLGSRGLQITTSSTESDYYQSSPGAMSELESESHYASGGKSSWPQNSEQPRQPQDARYWERRRKNNLAAKKSRDARRVRENQLRIKVLCLENANQMLRSKVSLEKEVNTEMRERIKVIEAVEGDHRVSLPKEPR
eukprot:maker-scaffold496_size155344-snap-gene-0.23 protein:Tk03357 transcript:maker-scaffold496_size155344-snap-gene-0.23-mRNA-1 annotation:"thyrotroph embryonic factor"